jgi:hypothetical protein
VESKADDVIIRLLIRPQRRRSLPHGLTAFISAPNRKETVMNKIRTIITQDAEVDDQNSLRHFLFYANEVDLQGIVQTSSKLH